MISGGAPQSSELAYAAHKRIFDAIAAGDSIEAQTAMQEHLEQVSTLYWQVKDSLDG